MSDNLLLNTTKVDLRVILKEKLRRKKLARNTIEARYSMKEAGLEKLKSDKITDDQKKRIKEQIKILDEIEDAEIERELNNNGADPDNHLDE